MGLPAIRDLRMNDSFPRASGFQIAFFIFAVVFLATPLQRYVGPSLITDGNFERSLGRLWIFMPALLILLGVPRLRSFCARELARPIEKADSFEVAVVTAAKGLVLPFAYVGGVALWYWLTRGEMGLARWVGDWTSPLEAFARAKSADGIVFTFFLGALLGPVIEELVFRGLLYRAWEAQWGWFPAMLATSAVFAAYHPAHVSAFLSSIVFVVLYRRTGTIWASIVAHSAYNALIWYPFLGQWIFRKAGRDTGEIDQWPVHLAALAVATIALPVYVWLARGRYLGRTRSSDALLPAH